MKMQVYLSAVLLFVITYLGAANIHSDFYQKRFSHLVSSTKKISLSDYKEAFNPSLIKFEDNYLLTFRYCPSESERWVSFIGVVVLNKSFKPISEPQLIDTRSGIFETPSQSEDCRIFIYNGKLYLIYNDNIEITDPNQLQRRDIFIAELCFEKDSFSVVNPLKLFHQDQYATQRWQKNWVPFEWNKKLLLGYTINPHEVLLTDLTTGLCKPIHSNKFKYKWLWGELRGGTPALLVDDEYLAFFHCSKFTYSKASNKKSMWHYYMGAYTFSSQPPFNITRISPSPIMCEDFYTKSNHPKRVIFPGGFVVDGDNIHIAYGKDDTEIWIATIDKTALMNSLVPVKN